MTRYALIAALLGGLGLTAALWFVAGQRDSARAEAARLARELATARQVMAQQAQSVAVHRAWLKRAEEVAAAAAAAEADILQMEGADAPLSDYLRGVFDRVR